MHYNIALLNAKGKIMLRINGIQNNNYNTTQNTKLSFGMALKINESAIPVIKKQAFQLETNARGNFLREIEDASKNEKDNPVNIIIRKSKFRKALVAEVIDSEEGKKLGSTKKKTFSQPFGKKIVSLKFLDKARDYALRLSNVNDDVKKTMSTVTTISDEPKKKGIFSLLKTINWG